MIRSLSFSILIGLLIVSVTSPVMADSPQDDHATLGTIPTDSNGRRLNLDFDSGTLADWTAEGDAFRGQPIEGDRINRRRGDMHSRHAGRFWIGTYEVGGDALKGSLTSAPFRVTKPFASFLISGGSQSKTYVELVRKDTAKTVFRTSGDDVEDMERVVADLTGHLGKEIFIRVVDQESGGWGHINFDDFRLHDTKPPVPPRRRPEALDVFQHSGLGPIEAARAMTVPPEFQVSLFAGEPDIVQPIAMAIDDRGRVWVAEAYSYPRRVPDNQAKDRILIFEDTDGDGRFNTRKIFADHLNLVSGLALGFGGVWVGAAPYMMFIPDADQDDRPDGPPRILLDGWGQHDTHETLNTFTWGPDGWLYGCHGVFTHSLVGKPGTPREKRTPINAGIWRYHPTRHEFEVFAQGTSNPWGIDFDARGQLIITACVIPHLYHMIQGGRYERQAGQHFNSYTYDDIKTIADHRHYLGATPHSGNGRSDNVGGGHAHSGAMIYLGGAFPDEYRGSLFMNNIHGARINRDVLKPSGSGFIGSHAPDFLMANDVWSQIVHLEYGPDGSIYMIDWYDKNQCHRNETEVHDRTNGRIFKVSFHQGSPPPADLGKLKSEALVALQTSRNEWYARHARRILQERGEDPEAQALLLQLEFVNLDKPDVQLRILLTRYAVGGLANVDAIIRKLGDADPTIRAWTIQLAIDQGVSPKSVLSMFETLARKDTSPMVRLYLASALQRIPLENRWDILAGLVAHSEDISDHNLPLMYWYAAEPLATLDPRRAIRLATSSHIPRVQEFMARRIGSIGTSEALAVLVEELSRAPSSAQRETLLLGIEEGLRGRRQVSMPADWPRVFASLLADKEPRVRSRSVALALTFGDPTARATLRAVLSDSKADIALRREALAALLKVKDPSLPPLLRSLLADPGLTGHSVRGLSQYDDPTTPGVLIGRYSKFEPSERRDALNTLSARKEWARGLLSAVEAGKITRVDLTADLVRQIRNFKDTDLDSRISRIWGSVRDTSVDRKKSIARYKEMLTSPPSRKPDPSLGRSVFTRTCQQCHTLFGVGGQVGPDLTGSNRKDLDYLLSNVLDPSALIGKDYLAQVIATSDGRVLTGIIRAEDKDSLTLVTANETMTLPKSDIEERRQSELSMMPEDLLTPLSEHDVRSLVLYLASPAQIPLPPGQSDRKTP